MPQTSVTALITGASSGIGRELARLFARDGHSLILVARRQGVLSEAAAECEALGAQGVEVIAADLSVKEGPGYVEAEVIRRGMMVDVLVNNAGLGLWGLFQDNDLGQLLAMLQLNVIALTEMTKRFLGGMVQRQRGYILNVASTAAFQPGPYMAAYFASKAYVLHFSEAIAEELAGSGVHVTALCPGPTETEFAGAGGAARAKMFQQRGLPRAAEVAKGGYRAMWRGQRVYIHGWQNRVLAVAVGLLPRRWVTTIVRKTKCAPAPGSSAAIH